jgi:glycosyltransferase involved in cell wall biosynthesis
MVPTTEIKNKLWDKGIKNTKLWPRGVYPEKFNIQYRSQTLRKQWGAQNKKVILFSGRFVWYKGLDSFIEVYNLFKKKGPKDVVFVLAGSGPIFRVLKKQMPDAHFPGYLSGKELSRVYASSDLFLFPSATETFGNVVLEALSSGLPSVVSDRGGCKEIINKSGAGLVAKTNDPVDFYNKCVQILKEKVFYEELRKNALEYAKSQTWDANNSLVIKEYIRLNTNKIKKDYNYESKSDAVYK